MLHRHHILAFIAALVLLVPMFAGFQARGVVAQDGTAPNEDISGTINVAMVANPQMVALEEIVQGGAFNELYPNIDVQFTILPENEIRATITQDVGTDGGQFDAVTVGTFEVPIWGSFGWLEELGEDARADENYNFDDIFQAHVDGLSSEDGVYGLPFYGESSMLFYRTDLVEAAGLEVPERPTWTEVRDIAAQLHSDETAGICLRGLPGWGEQLAPLTTVINAFGGRWFDEDWNAQLDSPETAEAIRFYIETVQEYGPAGTEQNGFTECEQLFVTGQVAMWYDATSAAELISAEDENPEYFQNVGYAYPPTQADENNAGNWLWNWAFAIPSTTDNPEAARAFVKWATSTQYYETITTEQGFGRAPTGARQSTYDDPEYLEFAEPFAQIVLDAINQSDPNEPTLRPVPYNGGQFVRIPEFQELGNEVSLIFAEAIVGSITIDEAISRANDLANQIAVDGGYQD